MATQQKYSKLKQKVNRDEVEPLLNRSTDCIELFLFNNFEKAIGIYNAICSVCCAEQNFIVISTNRKKKII